jgi:hypothetical protein
MQALKYSSKHSSGGRGDWCAKPKLLNKPSAKEPAAAVVVAP